MKPKQIKPNQTKLQYFMHLISKDWFWFVHIPFCCQNFVVKILWSDFSLLNNFLYIAFPAIHFRRKWLSGIIVIRNSSNKNTSPWKRPLGIFTSEGLEFSRSIPPFSFPWYLSWSLWFCLLVWVFSNFHICWSKSEVFF